MVICLERGADLHMAQLMPLPLTVYCFRKIQIGFAFLVQAHPGSPGHRAIKRVCVCVCMLLTAVAISILKASGRTFRDWFPKMMVEINLNVAVCDDSASSSVSNRDVLVQVGHLL